MKYVSKGGICGGWRAICECEWTEALQALLVCEAVREQSRRFWNSF